MNTTTTLHSGSRLRIGRYTDTAAPVAAYWPGTCSGPVSGAVIGPKASGKTVLLGRVADVAESGGSRVWHLSAAGAVFGRYRAEARRAGEAMLAAAENIVRCRQTLARPGPIGWPSRMRVLLVLDDPELVIPDLGVAERWARLAGEGPACGVAVIAAAQSLRHESFADCQPLRDVLTRQWVVLRADQVAYAETLLDVPVDPPPPAHVAWMRTPDGPRPVRLDPLRGEVR